MNKSQLIDTLSARFEGNRKQAAHALEAVLDTITREVAKGEKVAITGFGSFEKRIREARWVRNPQTGARMKAKKTAVPKFTAGQDLKNVVSGAKKLPKAVATAGGSAAKKASAPAKKAAAAARSTAKKTTTKKAGEEGTGEEDGRQEDDGEEGARQEDGREEGARQEDHDEEDGREEGARQEEHHEEDGCQEVDRQEDDGEEGTRQEGAGKEDGEEDRQEVLNHAATGAVRPDGPCRHL